jgi:hypothetical protein
LEKNNCEVFIAGSGDSLELLKQEFPGKKFFELPSYRITYSTKVPLMLHLGLRSPSILSAIKKENKDTLNIVKAEKIDRIISDNRYGCHHPGIKTAIIIHQLSIQLPPFMRSLANYYNRKFIGRFTQCWVPDTPDHRLSGNLSVSKSVDSKFIGPLSRMKRKGNVTPQIHLLGLVSGPEPARTDFDELLTEQLRRSGRSYKIVRGLPAAGDFLSTEHSFTHLQSAQLNELIEAAEVVVCRPGYSTIMDLAALGKKAIFVPTPGQTEQLYLAGEMHRKKIAPMVSQKNLSLPLDELKDYTGFREDYFDNNLLQTTLREFLG